MLTLKSVNPVQLGLIQGIITGAIGLLFGIIVALIGSVAPRASFAMFGGLAAIVFIPLFYAFIGFLGGLITALLFNLAAKVTGGVQMEFAERQ